MSDNIITVRANYTCDDYKTAETVVLCKYFKITNNNSPN